MYADCMLVWKIVCNRRGVSRLPSISPVSGSTIMPWPSQPLRSRTGESCRLNSSNVVPFFNDVASAWRMSWSTSVFITPATVNAFA